MIRLTNISKNYGKEKIVDNLSLSIPKGAVFGFLGPNGAGKTTTIKMIVGISPVSSGTIEIEGKDMRVTKNKSLIGFMPEDPYFYDHLTAKEFLEFMGSLNPNNNLTIQQFNNLLKEVGLESAADQPIVTFSKGMKQRLGLAQAIVSNPDYIFLDEPLDGLDPIGRREFKKIILKLKKEGKTIFFNSHVLSDVQELCDQIGIINKGKLIYAGDVKSFCGKKSLEEKFVEIIEKVKQ